MLPSWSAWRETGWLRFISESRPVLERVLVTVKTYPTLSTTYGETVCTAGLREDGSWVRIYPVPFRRLEEVQQYKKFDWIESDLRPNPKDPRPETRRPVDLKGFRTVDHLGTENEWRERRRIVLGTGRVDTSLDELIQRAKANTDSLATLRPDKLIDFIVQKEEREWDPVKLEALRQSQQQLDMFDDDSWRKTFEVIPKLPYSFSYRYSDSNGRVTKMQILDWEIGALYWNCLRAAEGDERVALQKVRERYWDDFSKKDLHFFLGTTQQYHFVAPNPWVIVGVFPIPYESQLGLLG